MFSIFKYLIVLTIINIFVFYRALMKLKFTKGFSWVIDLGILLELCFSLLLLCLIFLSYIILYIFHKEFSSF